MSDEKYTLPPVRGTTEQERALLDPSIYKRFDDLDQSGKVALEVSVSETIAYMMMSGLS